MAVFIAFYITVIMPFVHVFGVILTSVDDNKVINGGLYGLVSFQIYC